MRRVLFLASVLAGAVLVGGCTSLARVDDNAVNERLQARGAPAANFRPTSSPAALPAAPLDVRQAVELAFERSPAVRELYAELGVSAADLVAARTLPNPTLGYSRLTGGDVAKTTRSASLNFADLLLMPARARFAGVEFEITRDRVASRLLALEHDVNVAWYDAVAASQGAEVADLAARTAKAAAEYARRLDTAGNITPRALALELAAAASAGIDAARAHAEALRARATLATLIGLSTRDDWRIASRLPALPPETPPADLVDRALVTRLDLAAARREAAAFDSALITARAWRWLGEFELGYERETEADGTRLRGPTFAIKLPLFGLNRAAVLRASAARDAASARRDALELAVRNDAALALDRMATARGIADAYRSTLLPQREAATARTLEEVNSMLSGAFELLATRREQFAAYREYIDAVRDYWLARVDLERALGANLPAAADTATLDLGPTGESR